MDITTITIFILAVFVGFEIITKVPPTLHTPLMSGSNAISGIAIIGANGSGKSTLLGLLSGKIKQDSGVLKINKER